MVLHGPPGSGKTTLARIVAERSRAAFEELSAVAAGRAEVRAVIERAAHRRDTGGAQTVLFLDEIHRFNKAQQDALLPAVEEGLVTLIGATTENPAFEVGGALLSRVRVYALRALTPEELAMVLRRAAAAGAGAAGGEHTPAASEGALEVDDGALEFLAARSEGDARTALNALELAAATAAELGEQRVTLARVEDALQRRAVLYDKQGDRHYDYISAWIKATRGSDPDASLYYLAVMLEGGEDPRFIVRRMVILASEDIGNADPGALSVATATAQAVEHVGLPEARYALAQAAIYLSLAPKSDAAGRALSAAERHVREHGAAPVPGWLRSGPRPGQDENLPSGYDNPHGHPGHVAAQELLPEGVDGKRFYAPDEAEAELASRLARIRRARGPEQR
jgi:putative ATPase